MCLTIRQQIGGASEELSTLCVDHFTDQRRMSKRKFEWCWVCNSWFGGSAVLWTRNRGTAEPANDNRKRSSEPLY